MDTLRASLKSTLIAASLANVGSKVFDSLNTEEALDKLEETIFTAAALILGDDRSDSRQFTPTRTRNEVEIDILIAIKTITLQASADAIALSVISLLSNNDLGITGTGVITTSEVVEGGVLSEITDQIAVKIITFRAVILDDK